MSEKNLEELLRLLGTSEELVYRISEAIKEAQRMGLTQIERILNTIKSYVELLRRELEVKIEDIA
ncbi:MAG: hypothetical protein ACXQTI_09980 [Candidatus Nezhaarchaeales archaeon]